MAVALVSQMHRQYIRPEPLHRRPVDTWEWLAVNGCVELAAVRQRLMQAERENAELQQQLAESKIREQEWKQRVPVETSIRSSRMEKREQLTDMDTSCDSAKCSRSSLLLSSCEPHHVSASVSDGDAHPPSRHMPCTAAASSHADSIHRRKRPRLHSSSDNDQTMTHQPCNDSSSNNTPSGSSCANVARSGWNNRNEEKSQHEPRMMRNEMGDDDSQIESNMTMNDGSMEPDDDGHNVGGARQSNVGCHQDIEMMSSSGSISRRISHDEGQSSSAQAEPAAPTSAASHSAPSSSVAAASFPCASTSASASSSLSPHLPVMSRTGYEMGVTLVMQFLPFRDVISAAATCRTWHRAACSPLIWNNGGGGRPVLYVSLTSIRMRNKLQFAVRMRHDEYVSEREWKPSKLLFSLISSSILRNIVALRLEWTATPSLNAYELEAMLRDGPCLNKYAKLFSSRFDILYRLFPLLGSRIILICCCFVSLSLILYGVECGRCVGHLQLHQTILLSLLSMPFDACRRHGNRNDVHH